MIKFIRCKLLLMAHWLSHRQFGCASCLDEVNYSAKCHTEIVELMKKEGMKHND